MFNGLSMTFNPVLAALMSARIVPSFDPLTLFAAGEPGVWYDPSDFSTLFQDSAGTTPVTAVEQPVGLMLDKSKGLVLGPELVTNGDFSNGTTGWTANNAVISSANGQLTVNDSANLGAWSSAVQQINVVSGKTYRLTFDVISTSTGCAVALNTSATANVPPPTQILNNGGMLAGSKTFIFTATSATYLFIEVDGTGTAVFDNISIREIPGNHAYQTTATSRPVISARYNLLTKTEQFDGAVWGKSGLSVLANAAFAPDGTLSADKLVEGTSSGSHALLRGITYTSGVSYKHRFVFQPAGRERVRLLVGNPAIISYDVTFDLIGKTAIVGAGSAEIRDIGGGRCEVSVTATAASSGTTNCNIQLVQSGTTASYTGDGTSGIYIWGADLRVADDGANLPPYQRVNTDTDYDSDPAKFPRYMRFDGVDDWLVTNTITPGIDKVQVFAGVKKLSDAARGTIVEFGTGVENGVFSFFNFSDARLYFESKGTTTRQAISSAFPSPVSVVATGAASISGDSVTLRLSGSPVGSSTADQGTGNYLAYPLYIGRRGDTTLPFNGHLYSLIVRFGYNLPAATIEKTEKYINTKTRAY